jgi:hypothetical protein
MNYVPFFTEAPPDPPEQVAVGIAYCEKYLRLCFRDFRRAQAMLALLWLPERLGFAWAHRAADRQRDIIAECEYSYDDLWWDLVKLQTRGTTASFVIGMAPEAWVNRNCVSE